MSRRKRSKFNRTIQTTTQRKDARQKCNQEQLASVLDGFLPDDSIFSKMRLHGNTKWLPKCLVWLALIWAWSESRHVTDAYTEAVQCCQDMFRFFVPQTYQGFMGALVKWTSTLMKILLPVLHEKMEEIGGKFWRIDGWVPIAFDGSRSTAPRSIANEQALCAKNFGKGKTAKYRKKKTKGMRRRKNEKQKPQPQEPQAWITMMWHMGLRLPWMWRLGPSNSSERGHVIEMIEQGKYSKMTLFCGDAGFVGFPLWSAIVERGGHFLVRVGANVSLLVESADYQLGKNGVVLCWPRTMQSTQLPLRLRLVQVRIGKTRVYLLTSVLDPKKLTISQMVKFYKMRWGIEVEFRGLKQTLDRAKLRCRNDQRVFVELHWSILAMAVAELVALQVQLAQRSQKQRQDPTTPDPAKRSLANTLRAIRRCLRRPHEIPDPHKQLTTLLREAVTDSYLRKSSKRARYRPPNPDKKPLGQPAVRQLTAKERKTLCQISKKTAA